MFFLRSVVKKEYGKIAINATKPFSEKKLWYPYIEIWKSLIIENSYVQFKKLLIQKPPKNFIYFQKIFKFVGI